MRIEVAYAKPDRQVLQELELAPGATVSDAIAAAFDGALELEVAALQAGIWGRPVPRSQVLSDGDRVEMYRALEMDPREARRRLAAADESGDG